MIRKLDPSENSGQNLIVKCACGLPMRRHEWAAHWNGCSAGAAVPVTESDVQALLHHEQHMRDIHGIEKLHGAPAPAA